MASINLPTKKITVQGNPGETIASALGSAGVRVYAPCAGRGICGKCKVVVEEERGLSAPNDIELAHLSSDEISSGVRLACQARISGDADLTILSTSAQAEDDVSILMEGQAAIGSLSPDDARVRVDTVLVNPESPARSDWERISLAFGLPQNSQPAAAGSPSGRGPAATPSIHLAQAAGEAMAKALDPAEADAEARPEKSPDKLTTPNTCANGNGAALTGILLDGELADILPRASKFPQEGTDGNWSPLGIALDIGTTTVVGYLADLTTGRVIGAKGSVNPQAAHGADLISRIAYAQSEEGLETLRLEIIEAINGLGGELLNEAGASPYDVYLVGAVGNTCMHHLCCGINPSRLAQIPYTPTVLESSPSSPAEVGLTCANPKGNFFFLPNIAGFVGSDALAVALITGMNEKAAPILAIDIGTNGEILLAANGRILACSTAAGPAFEGVNISCGMIAAPGAIDGVRMGKSDIECYVIGDVDPIGICGSGLISVIATLRKAEVISETGAFDPDAVNPRSPLGSRLIKGENGLQFVLAKPEAQGGAVVLTQRDVREVQLAKAAIRAGVEILLAESGIAAADLTQIVLAGAFGTYLDVEAATAIGLLPSAGEARLVSVGNAAGQGIILALSSRRAYDEARRLARRVEHVELGANPLFMEVFTDSMFLVRG